MPALFNTAQAAARLQALHEAALALEGELRALRMIGLAHAVAELLLEDRGTNAIRIAITQQEMPSLLQMFGPAAGGQRCLHVGVKLEPANKLVDLPAGTIPAHVLGEGECRIERSDPQVQEILALYSDRRELAVLMLCELLEPCFEQVSQVAYVNQLT